MQNFNKINTQKGERGFIKTIILVVVGIVAVKYIFDIDIIEWYNSPTGQKYAGTVWNLIKDFYFWVDSLFRRFF